MSRARAALRVPTPAQTGPSLPPGTDLPIRGLTPFVTPSSSFYRVDTTLILPQISPGSWQLRIHGMVEREIMLSFHELLKLPLTEDYITLTCVSNPVGGPYIGNARWLGPSLARVLRMAGIRGGADQLLCTSVDGFTSGAPVQKLAFDKVGGTIAQEITRNAFSSVVLASLLIICYLTIRFAIGGFMNGLKFGVCAVVAQIHDLLTVTGIFALMGMLRGWQVDSLFVTAALTVLGFVLWWPAGLALLTFVLLSGRLRAMNCGGGQWHNTQDGGRAGWAPWGRRCGRCWSG